MCRKVGGWVLSFQTLQIHLLENIPNPIGNKSRILGFNLHTKIPSSIKTLDFLYNNANIGKFIREKVFDLHSVWPQNLFYMWMSLESKSLDNYFQYFACVIVCLMNVNKLTYSRIFLLCCISKIIVDIFHENGFNKMLCIF